MDGQALPKTLVYLAVLDMLFDFTEWLNYPHLMCSVHLLVRCAFWKHWLVGLRDPVQYIAVVPGEAHLNDTVDVLRWRPILRFVRGGA